jgi:D-alanyl-D-alanine carboxypeptidase
MRRTAALPILVVLLVCLYLRVDAALQAPAFAPGVDRIVREVLHRTGVPSASIAVITGGEIAYTHATGDARLEPRLAATPAMRYGIGSISKQFTSAAILMLQEDGKLALNDPVGKYVPGLARGNDVTIRQILSHTSGYQDYWPQDYVMKGMLQPTTAQQILDTWANRALDFDPGTKWQYSNTNYVIAGLIVDKVAGEPLWKLLDRRIFTPLGMRSVTNIDERPLPATDATGYFRYALGPLRPAPKEGPGWLFAAGEIAATAEDVARWDRSILKESVLKPGSYRQLETEVVLSSGVGTQYALGLTVRSVGGHRQLEHSGEVSGFTAENIVYPDDGVAVVVLTNQDAAGGASDIGREVADLLLASTTTVDQGRTEMIRRIFDDLRKGKIDRALFTDNANAYFSAQALADYAASLGPLGSYTTFISTGTRLRGGMIQRGFSVRFKTKTLTISIFELPDGKIEQFLVIG